MAADDEGARPPASLSRMSKEAGCQPGQRPQGPAEAIGGIEAVIYRDGRAELDPSPVGGIAS